MTQLALPLRLADHAVFGSFLRSGNETLVGLLEDIAAGASRSGCWISGPAAAGKTHLMQAVCERAGDASIYLPLDLLVDGGPDVLDGLASRELVCLDSVDAVTGRADWEHALFALCNQVADAGGVLVVAARVAPREAGIALPDLLSRMTQLPTFRLQSLEDADRGRALQLRARHRGLDLPDDTARYLLTRSRRDMASLYHLLDKLDAEALRAQRRLTIPFVRTILDQAPASGS